MGEDVPLDIGIVINDLYRRLVKDYGWSLRDIDDTNLETLFDFLLMEGPKDPNTMVIGGKEYKRVAPGEAPSWL